MMMMWGLKPLRGFLRGAGGAAAVPLLLLLCSAVWAPRYSFALGGGGGGGKEAGGSSSSSLFTLSADFGAARSKFAVFRGGARDPAAAGGVSVHQSLIGLLFPFLSQVKTAAKDGEGEEIKPSLGVPRSVFGRDAALLRTRGNALAFGFVEDLLEDKISENPRVAPCVPQEKQGQGQGLEASPLWLMAGTGNEGGADAAEACGGETLVFGPLAGSTGEGVVLCPAGAKEDPAGLAVSATRAELTSMAMVHVRALAATASQESGGVLRATTVFNSTQHLVMPVSSFVPVSSLSMMREAAMIAGFPITTLVPDYVAWGLADAVRFRRLHLREGASAGANDDRAPPASEDLLIVDAGHTATTVALVRQERLSAGAAKVGRLSVLAQGNIRSFAGAAFDEALATLIADTAELPPSLFPRGGKDADEASGVSRRTLARVADRLAREAKRVKEVLSANRVTAANVDVSDVAPDSTHQTEVQVTRDAFKALPAFQTGRTDLIAEVGRVLAARSSSAPPLRVMLAGGSSRIPELKAILVEATGISQAELAHQHTNSDEGAVLGAQFFTEFCGADGPLGVTFVDDVSVYGTVDQRLQDSLKCLSMGAYDRAQQNLLQQLKRNALMDALERMHSDLEGLVFETQEQVSNGKSAKAGERSAATEKAHIELAEAVKAAEARIHEFEENGDGWFARSDVDMARIHESVSKDVEELRTRAHALYGELKELERLQSVVEMCESFVPKMRNSVKKWAAKAQGASAGRVARMEDSLADLHIYCNQIKPLLDSGESLEWLPAPAKARKKGKKSGDSSDRLTPKAATAELRRLMDAFRKDFSNAQRDAKQAARRQAAKQDWASTGSDFVYPVLGFFAVLGAAIGAFFLQRELKNRRHNSVGGRQANRRQLAQMRKKRFKGM